MSKVKSSLTLSESILEEASGWFIDFNEGELDAAGREQFHQWLRRSPEHIRAYIEIAAAWEDSSRLNSSRTQDIDALIAQAQAEQNIVSLSAPSAARRLFVLSRAQRPGMRFYPKLLALAASLTLAVVSVWIYSQRNTYVTVTGEQRTITLADGSTVMLNSRSRLKVRFSENQRFVELLDGQALFEVKKDATRPFIVNSDSTRVRAVGTQFDVYRKHTDTVVTVIEGRVAVTSASARKEKIVTGAEEVIKGMQNQPPAQRQSEVLLTAGDRLTVTSQLASRPIRVNPVLATAWTQRKLIFDETPLMEVVAEFNRYNNRQIVIEDTGLANFHIRGNFQANDPDRLVQFLRERFEVRVSEQDNEIRIARN